MKRSDLPYFATTVGPDGVTHYLIAGSAKAAHQHVKEVTDLVDPRVGEVCPHLVLAIPLRKFDAVDYAVLEQIGRDEAETPPADALSDEVVDRHLDAVLHASGSALRHYSLPKSLADMRAAMRAALKDGARYLFRGEGIARAAKEGGGQ